MADITITVPDAVVPRVLAALQRRIPRNEGETNGQYARRAISETIKKDVIEIEEADALSQVDGPARVARVIQRRTDLSGIG